MHWATTSRCVSQPRKSTPLPLGSHWIGACAKHWSAASYSGKHGEFSTIEMLQ
jgi:hypothetical protein